MVSIKDGIARDSGLDKFQAGERVEFARGVKGMALILENEKIRIAIVGTICTTALKERDVSHAPEVEIQIRHANYTSLSTCSSARSSHDTPYSDPRENFIALFFKQSEQVIEPHSEWRQQKKPMC
jgi:hypothetical protein